MPAAGISFWKDLNFFSESKEQILQSNKYLIDKKINYKGNKEYEDFVIKTNAKKLHQIVTKSRANKAL